VHGSIPYVESVGPLCVGIDPSAEALQAAGLPDNPQGALEFGRAVIAAAISRVGIVKLQVAYFERFGALGIGALEIIIREARADGLAVIADAKRGDIGSTMNGYADAWLGIRNASRAMRLPVSPYSDSDSLEPAFSLAETRWFDCFRAQRNIEPRCRSGSTWSVAGTRLPALVAEFARVRTGDS